MKKVIHKSFVYCICIVALEESSWDNILASRRKAYDSCLKKLENLFQLKISPLNSNGNLLSDEEYAKQKTELMKEKARLEEILKDTEGSVGKWLEAGEKPLILPDTLLRKKLRYYNL
ncbi:MAG: hypothetical protein ACUVV5_12060 [Candidatus Aminicenantales bacterium]